MKILMIGVDHLKADLAVREAFAFTNMQREEALKELYNREGILGVLILSTCNRTELWISTDLDDIELSGLLCEVKGLEEKEYRDYFVVRQGEDAINHILSTACGLNSKIFGEDQISTQIIEALEVSKKLKTSDQVINKVFQTAITASKRVKTLVDMGGYKPSVAAKGIEKLKGLHDTLKDKICLIIGNGRMGELVAEHLVEQGAKVYMTLRKKYHHGEDFKSIIPSGCIMVDYDKRYDYLKEADIVVSATMSPHFTIGLKHLEGVEIKEPALWLDLAVPRDIDSKIAQVYDIEILNIDQMEEAPDIEWSKELNRAGEILGDYNDELREWLTFRKMLPKIWTVKKRTAKDVYKRMEKKICSMDLEKEQEDQIKNLVEESSVKAVNKLVCGLKENLSIELWDEVYEALKKSALKETLKS